MRDRLKCSRLRAMARATTWERCPIREAHRAALATRRDEPMRLIETLDAKVFMPSPPIIDQRDRLRATMLCPHSCRAKPVR